MRTPIVDGLIGAAILPVLTTAPTTGLIVHAHNHAGQPTPTSATVAPELSIPTPVATTIASRGDSTIGQHLLAIWEVLCSRCPRRAPDGSCVLNDLPSTVVIAALLQPPSLRSAQHGHDGRPASVIVALEQAISEALPRRPEYPSAGALILGQSLRGPHRESTRGQPFSPTGTTIARLLEILARKYARARKREIRRRKVG